MKYYYIIQNALLDFGSKGLNLAGKFFVRGKPDPDDPNYIEFDEEPFSLN